MFLDFLFSMTMMIIQSYMNLMLWFMQIFLYEYIYSVQNIYFCIEAELQYFHGLCFWMQMFCCVMQAGA